MNVPKITQIFRLAGLLGWQDVRQAYRRSALGPFWITIGMAIQIATMGIVFSLIFKMEIREYLPFLATNMILWGFFSSVIIEGCASLIAGESIIKQLEVPYSMFAIRVIWKNIVNLSHNAVLLPIIFLIFSTPIDFGPLLLFIPGLVLLLANLAWLTMLLGLFCARYRDMAPIINSLLTVVYFVTPIMWLPNLLGNNLLAHLLLGLNPVYHLFQIVRQPLLGEYPTLENWFAAVAILIVGALATKLSYKKFQSLIPFWV